MSLLEQEVGSNPTTSPAANAPAAPPAAPAAPSVDDAGEEVSSVDWAKESEFVEEVDPGESIEDPTPPVAPTPPAPIPAPVAPAQPPAAAAPAPAPAPAAPAAPVVPAAPAAAAPATAPAPAPAPAAPPAPVPAAPAETAEQQAARQKAEREATEKAAKEQFDSLVSSYALPEDLATKLQTEPEKVLPWLAAKVHESVVNRVTELMHGQLPSMIKTMQGVERAEAEAKKAFYDRWPALAAHEETVKRAGMMFRQLNPSAPPDKAIEAIGKMVCESLGLPIAGVPGAQPPAPPVASPAPYRPTGGGGAPAGAPPQDNLFTQLAEEMLQDGD